MGFWDSVFAIPNAFFANLRGEKVTAIGEPLPIDAGITFENAPTVLAFREDPSNLYLPGKSPTEQIATGYAGWDNTLAAGWLPGGDAPDLPDWFPDPDELKGSLFVLAAIGIGLFAVSR